MRTGTANAVEQAERVSGTTVLDLSFSFTEGNEIPFLVYLLYKQTLRENMGDFL